MSNSNLSYSAAAGDFSTEESRVAFLVRALLCDLRTAEPVKVVSVTNNGGVSPIGFVDIQPMVGMVDAAGAVYEHGTIYNVPYMRIQGGSSAVIIDPQVGDIGVAVFCHRDISVVKNTGEPGAPGSTRKHDFADAVYLMSIVKAAPTQYVQCNDEGITIHSPTKVKITAPVAEVTTTTSATITTPIASVVAGTSASVTAPSISLGASGQTLLSLVNQTFQSLFNSHTHKSNGTGSQTDAPLQQMASTHLTTTVKGG